MPMHAKKTKPQKEKTPQRLTIEDVMNQDSDKSFEREVLRPAVEYARAAENARLATKPKDSNQPPIKKASLGKSTINDAPALRLQTATGSANEPTANSALTKANTKPASAGHLQSSSFLGMESDTKTASEGRRQTKPATKLFNRPAPQKTSYIIKIPMKQRQAPTTASRERQTIDLTHQHLNRANHEESKNEKGPQATDLRSGLVGRPSEFPFGKALVSKADPSQFPQAPAQPGKDKAQNKAEQKSQRQLAVAELRKEFMCTICWETYDPSITELRPILFACTEHNACLGCVQTKYGVEFMPEKQRCFLCKKPKTGPQQINRTLEMLQKKMEEAIPHLITEGTQRTIDRRRRQQENKKRLKEGKQTK